MNVQPTLARSVWILARNVAVAVVQTMHRHPKNRASLDCQVSANRNDVGEPFGYLKSAMRKEPVVSQRQSEARDGVEDQETNDRGARVKIER